MAAEAPFSIPLTVVCRVICGVVVALATEPVKPLAVNTATEVTEPLPPVTDKVPPEKVNPEPIMTAEKPPEPLPESSPLVDVAGAYDVLEAAVTNPLALTVTLL